MKKHVLFLLASFIIFSSSCKKNAPMPTPAEPLGTGNLTLKATEKILTDSVWWRDTPSSSPHWQLQFSMNDLIDAGRDIVTFGEESSYGAPTFTNDSNDSFDLYISKGFTYLTIKDDVAASSLTEFSTSYKITAISSKGVTLVPTDPQTSSMPAPTFPVTTLVLVKAQY